ncbi:MAG: ATP-binding protein [bacterium]
MIISILSGKGGTGKTTVAVNLALSLSERGVCFFDCDVEEPNAHIFLKPTIEERERISIKVPSIDLKLCDYCGVCSEFCQRHAIVVAKGRRKILTFSDLCNGCGGCSLFCPQKAISEVDREMGVVERGRAGEIKFVHGLLKVGELTGVPITRRIKKYIEGDKINIIDAPPGTSCPVVEAVLGSDRALLVTEPTPFGLHDLKMVVEIVRDIGIPFGVIVNRDGVGDGRVEEYCRSEDIPIHLKIPMDEKIARLYSIGIPFVEAIPEWKKKFAAAFDEGIGEPKNVILSGAKE